MQKSMREIDELYDIEAEIEDQKRQKNQIAKKFDRSQRKAFEY